MAALKVSVVALEQSGIGSVAVGPARLPDSGWLRRLHKFPHVSRIEQFQLRLPALFLWLANCYFAGDSLEFPALVYPKNLVAFDF